MDLTEYWTSERNKQYLELKCSKTAKHRGWTFHYAFFDVWGWKWWLERPDGKKESSGLNGGGTEQDLIADLKRVVDAYEGLPVLHKSPQGGTKVVQIPRAEWLPEWKNKIKVNQ